MSRGNKMKIPGPLNQQPGYVQLVNRNMDPSQPGEAYQTNFASEMSFGYQTQILSSPNLNPYQYSNPLPYQYAAFTQHGSVNGVAPQQLIPASNIENQSQILPLVIPQPISQSGDTTLKQHTKPKTRNQLAQCPPIPVSQCHYSPLTLSPTPVQYSNINQPNIPVQCSGLTGTQNIAQVNTSAYYSPPLVQYITPMPFNNMNQYNAPLKDNRTSRQSLLPSNEQTCYSYPHFAQNACLPPLPVVDQISGIPPQWPIQSNPQQYRMPELYNNTIQSHIVAQHCPVSPTQNSSKPETSNHLSTTASNNAIDYILSNQYIAERVKKGPIKIVYKNSFGVDSFYRVHMAPQSQQAIGKSNPPEMQTVSPSTPKQWNLSAAEFYPSIRPSQEGCKWSQIVQHAENAQPEATSLKLRNAEFNPSKTQPGQENSELSQINQQPTKMSFATTTCKLNGEEFSASITHPTQDSSKLLSDTAVLKQNAADTFQPREEGSELTQAAQSVAKVPSGTTISKPGNVNFDPAETQHNQESLELPQTVQPKLNTLSEMAILKQNATTSQSHQEGLGLPPMVQSVSNLLPAQSSKNKLTKHELMLFTKENAQPQPKNAEGSIPRHLSNILHNLFIQEPSVVDACENNEWYIVELYNIPSEFSELDILKLFGDKPWYIVRCHANHALVLTASKEEANCVCEIQHDVIKARSILYGSDITIPTACSSELLENLNTFIKTTSENKKSTKKGNILVEPKTGDASTGNASKTVIGWKKNFKGSKKVLDISPESDKRPKTETSKMGQNT